MGFSDLRTGSRCLALALVFLLGGGARFAWAADHPADGHEVAVGHGDEGHAHGGAHGQEGPMTAYKADVDLAIWTLVTFFVFLAVLTKAAWKPLVAGLDARELSIRDNLAAAEDARLRAEKLLAEHEAKLADTANQVRSMLDEARKDAENSKNEIVAAAQKEAQASKQRALTEIEQARDQALNELFDAMARTVAAATEQVVGRSLNGDDQDRLIRESLDSFSRMRV